MKYIKMTGLAVVAAMAFMAFVGSGSASATTLDNGAGEHLSIGTTIEASLVGSAKLEAAGTVLDTCTGGGISGTTTTTGSANETVRGTVPAGALTWSGCTSTTHTDQGGELEIHHIAGTKNGTLTGTTFEVTVTFSGVNCNYGLSNSDTMVHVGTLTGSDTTPIMSINTTVVERTENKFLCPNTAVWNATYHVTKPNGLTVTAG